MFVHTKVETETKVLLGRGETDDVATPRRDDVAAGVTSSQQESDTLFTLSPTESHILTNKYNNHCWGCLPCPDRKMNSANLISCNGEPSFLAGPTEAFVTSSRN